MADKIKRLDGTKLLHLAGAMEEAALLGGTIVEMEAFRHQSCVGVRTRVYFRDSLVHAHRELIGHHTLCDLAYRPVSSLQISRAIEELKARRALVPEAEFDFPTIIS